MLDEFSFLQERRGEEVLVCNTLLWSAFVGFGLMFLLGVFLLHFIILWIWELSFCDMCSITVIIMLF